MFFINTKARIGGLAALLCAAILQEGHAMDASVQHLSKLISGNSLEVVNRYTPSIIHFEEGGKFRHMGPHGQSSEGVWRATDDSICFTVVPQPGGRAPQEFCLNLKGRSLGSTWTAEDPKNGTIKYKLLEGHQNLK